MLSAYRIAEAIEEAQRDGLLVDVNGLSGFSGNRLLGSLQRLARLNAGTGNCYVEIGVFRGLTLVSVSKAATDVAAFGIDNFSQFDPRGENRSIVHEQLAAHGLDNAHLVDSDFELALERLRDHIGNRHVGTYFVDGPHDYRSQLLCLELMKPFLAADAVIVVDDCNYLHVRQANRDFLVLNPEFKLVFEAYTHCHPQNMTSAELEAARAGWWNGANIIVRDHADALDPIYPPVVADRRIFFNDHLVHSSYCAANSNRAVEIVANLMRFRPIGALTAAAKLWRERRGTPTELRGARVSTNTFGTDLPAGRINSSIARGRDPRDVTND